MTDTQAAVMQSISEGRLIFPFDDELDALEEMAASGQLTAVESKRLEQLLALEAQFEPKDEAFHAAVKNGDLASAAAAAEQALTMLKAAA